MFNPMIQIGDKFIGRDYPTFIVAEAGCNHECDMDIAKKMIVTAKEVGADAIKFQTYKAEALVSGRAKAYWKDKNMLQVDYYKQLDKFEKEHYAELFEFAKEQGIIAFSTPFDLGSAHMLKELGVPVMKIASCDITNLGLICDISLMGLPVFLSTGGADVQAVHKALTILYKQHVPLVVLGCVLLNPAPLPYLRRVALLRQSFKDMLVGYSDHTVLHTIKPEAHIIPMMAVAAGACVYEKHFTIDKSMNISNHFFAADPQEFKVMVECIRRAEVLMGDAVFEPTEEEYKAYMSATKSWHMRIPIKKGEKFTYDHLKFVRPGTGLEFSAVNDINDSIATRDLEVDDMLEREDYECS